MGLWPLSSSVSNKRNSEVFTVDTVKQNKHLMLLFQQNVRAIYNCRENTCIVGQFKCSLCMAAQKNTSNITQFNKQLGPSKETFPPSVLVSLLFFFFFCWADWGYEMRNNITHGHTLLIRSEIEFTCCGFNSVAQGERTSKLWVDNQDGTILHLSTVFLFCLVRLNGTLVESDLQFLLL